MLLPFTLKNRCIPHRHEFCSQWRRSCRHSRVSLQLKVARTSDAQLHPSPPPDYSLKSNATAIACTMFCAYNALTTGQRMFWVPVFLATGQMLTASDSQKHWRELGKVTADSVQHAGQPIHPACPPSHQQKDGTPTGAGSFLLPSACLTFWLVLNSCGIVPFFGRAEGALTLLPSILLAPLAKALGQPAAIQPGQEAAVHGITDTVGISGELAVVLVFTMAAVLVGFIDDKLTLKSRQGTGPRGLPMSTQFMIQSATALALAAAVHMLFPQPIIDLAVLPSLVLSFPKWMYSALCAFTYISMVNAVNLTDGLDGLAASCTAMVFSTMAVVLVASHAKIAMFCLCLSGVMCAFGWWNKFPAAWFMGNSGSHGLGAALACVAAVTRSHAVLAPLSAIFAVEALSCVLQMAWWSYTKRVFGKGAKLIKRAPLHHHLEFSGWHETSIVVMAVAVQMLLCVAVLVIWPRGHIWP